MAVGPDSVTQLWPLLAAALAGYLLGSIPFGVLLSRLAGLADPRTTGSGNIGATNVFRSGNALVAAATLVLDAGKGAAAVLSASHWGTDAALIAGAAAVGGHVFPIWLRFRGGKGVATTFGVLLVVSLPVALAVIATWLAVALASRFVSLAALVAAACAPVYAWWLADPLRAVLILGLAVLVVAKHRNNIRRLASGEEPRIRLRRRGDRPTGGAD